ncbi:MAG TPA: ABC transporter permease [Alloacidobacterium sp.]|nr:ABC transporter permease [Alloacidobacterium sp.]
MSWRTVWARMLGFGHRRDWDREFQEEMRSHIEHLTEENLAAGMSPEEARRAAGITFGNLGRAAEKASAMWTLPCLESVLSDLKFGWRMLWKSPGFAVVTVLTLALGIGSSMGVFTIARAVLLRRMPYPHADQIVLMWGSDGRGSDRDQVSFTDTEDIRRRNHSFVEIANFSDWAPTLSGVAEPERVAGTQVGDGFFKVVGVQPSLGRAFTPEEQIDGHDRVVILSYELWQRRFNSDPSVLGRTIRLNAVPHVIVGVMPAGFEPLPSSLVQGGELYRPVAETYDNSQRRSEHLRAIARLKPGVTLADAQADVDAVARRMEADHPKEDADLHFRMAALQEDSARDLKPSLIVLLAGAFILLSIACANVAGLLLARGSSRQKEYALRTALGATRARSIRQSLVESLVMAATGGLLGLTVAYAAARVAATLAPRIGSPLAHASIDWQVLLFGGCAVLITTVLFGLAPALQITGASPAVALKQGGQASEVSRSGKKLHAAVIVCELASALVMLAVAALLIRSFIRLQDINLGFQTDHLLVMNVWVPYTKYREPDRQLAFYGELLHRVSSLPGVESAALVQNPPLRDFDGRAILPAGRSDDPRNYLSPQAYIVTPDYLRTMRIVLRDGRTFADSDNEKSEPVALVSRSLASQIWPGENAIGKKFQLLSDEKVDGHYPFRTVIGVVDDVRHFGPEGRVPPAIYVPFRQLPITWMSLVVRSQEPLALVPSIREQVRALDPEIAVFRIGKYEEELADSLLIRRIAMTLIAVFGGMSLFLAAVGLYGLVSYVVSRRMREFGIRAALGARPRDLLQLVLGSGLKLVALGVLIGLVGTVVAARLVTSILTGTGGANIVTLASSTALLASIGVLASVIPASRAARADPIETLRDE